MAATAPSVKMPRRLHVFGASGSGTTSLASLLAARHGHRHLDTDDFFWLPTDPPYREKRPREMRLELLRRALGEAPAWVLSGSLCGKVCTVPRGTKTMDRAGALTTPSPSLKLNSPLTT